jgi:hypothetical protein
MINNFLTKDVDGNWNTIPPIPADKIKNVNCHKFVLYVIGKISWEEMFSDLQTQKDAGLDFTYGEQARSISNIPFTIVNDLQSLYALVDMTCNVEEHYVGQILDKESEEMAHSFIFKKETDGKYLCFDKQGFKYPFSIHELGTMLDFVNKDGVKSYQNQKWRFVYIE